MMGGIVVYGVLSAERTLMEQGLEQKRLVREARLAARGKVTGRFRQRVNRLVQGINGPDATGSHSAAVDSRLAA